MFAEHNPNDKIFITLSNSEYCIEMSQISQLDSTTNITTLI